MCTFINLQSTLRKFNIEIFGSNIKTKTIKSDSKYLNKKRFFSSVEK